MLFWIIAALLTFLTVLTVIVPLARRESGHDNEIDFDKAIYHARVSEIEKDRELGRITDEEAKLALAEQGRKLIALADGGPVVEGKGGVKTRQLAALASVLLVPALALGLYLNFGSPGMQDQTLADRLQSAPENQSIDELVARAEGHLNSNPDDARGWAVLAPVYSRLGRHEDAVRAWSNVLRLAPQTPEIRATLGEAMLNLSNGVVTEDAQKLFREELSVNQSSARARFYLAMALGQEGKHREAVQAWDELIAGGTTKSPWMEAALDFRQKSAVEIGDTSVAKAPDDDNNAPGNPSREEVAAAAEMTAEDRREMISGMVSNLAEKLEADPSNKASWQRLIQSYIVLERPQDAANAIAKATKTHENDAEFLAVLDNFRKMLPADMVGTSGAGESTQ